MTLAVDASALLAIALDEPEASEFAGLLLHAQRKVMNPVNYWEVLVRVRAVHGLAGVAIVEELIQLFTIIVEPMTSQQVHLAAEAFARFGRGHLAGLNLGDCFAYAHAQEAAIPLLSKGTDFPQTDLPSARATK